jgi:hypothetical protein
MEDLSSKEQQLQAAAARAVGLEAALAAQGLRHATGLAEATAAHEGSMAALEELLAGARLAATEGALEQVQELERAQDSVHSLEEALASLDGEYGRVLSDRDQLLEQTTSLQSELQQTRGSLRRKTDEATMLQDITQVRWPRASSFSGDGGYPYFQ